MVESASWLPLVQIGLSGILLPAFLLAVRQFNRKNDKEREDDKERDKVLRRHQDNITKLEANVLTKDDLYHAISQTIKPMDVKIDNNTKVIEDVRGSMKDISDKLQNVSNSLSRQEGYREAKEKQTMSIVPNALPSNMTSNKTN